MTKKERRKRRRIERRNLANGMYHNKFLTKHHLIPKSRGGKDGAILVLDWDRHHQHWHSLFGNMTIHEIVEALQRIIRMKGVTNASH